MLRSRPVFAAIVTGALLITWGCSESSTAGKTQQRPSVPAAAAHWVVSVGDSYISGQGARWAGNTSGGPAQVDAEGPGTYAAPNGREIVPGCHRADISEVSVEGGRLRGENLACSGAQTSTTSAGGRVTPGIDFFNRRGRIGQALALQRFAASHRVTAVVLSIGGNDFRFSTIVTRCAVDFVASILARPTYCSDDPELRSLFSRTGRVDVRQRIAAALGNIGTAMHRAGYPPTSYRIIVQGYPSPLPPGPRMRYPQTVAARFALGGCPFFDRDATWANKTALAAINTTVAEAVQASHLENVTFLDLARAFAGHRLCERGVDQMQRTGLSSWQSLGAAQALEWVNEIYVKNRPWQAVESAHPNYWGTAAERGCLRHVLRHPSWTRVSCVQAGGTTVTGAPAMEVQPILNAGLP